MIRPHLFAATAALTLATVPAVSVAQDTSEETVELADDGEASSEADEMEQMLSGLSEMFAVEPLTADQEARLPLAQNIIAKMIPDGSMAEMMEKMMGRTMGPLMEMAGEISAKTILKETLGVDSFDRVLDEEQTSTLLSTFDPNWKERQKREAAVMPQIMVSMMGIMEPAMRKAMSELYAINFTSSELTEIDAFFSTDAGANFARKSFTMASDPRVMAASMEAMPQMMGAIANIEQTIAEATADLPEARSYADLSADERELVSKVTGLSAEDIENAQSEFAEEWEYGTVEDADGN